MANLKVTIVVRTKQGWVKSQKNGIGDPAGSYYIRWCEGAKPHLECVHGDYHSAELAQLRKQRELSAKSQGFVVPEEKPVIASGHRCEAVLQSYLQFLATTTKPNGRKYKKKGINGRESCIRQFLKVAGKVYVVLIDRADLLKYKAFLFKQNLAPDTVYNKLSCIVTWLKENQLVRIVKLLERGDWPICKKTKSHPFRDAEVDAMIQVAGEHELLIRFARATGMRKAEIMHAERCDIDPYRKSIYVRNKPFYDWETKTPAGVREIPLGDNLLRDLLALPDGLLFPNKHGQPDIRIDRRFEEVGGKANVQKPLDDRASWCHRWRDTFATERVREKVLTLLEVATVMGHEDIDMLSIYTEGLLMESNAARTAANNADRHGKAPQPIRVIRKEDENVA